MKHNKIKFDENSYCMLLKKCEEKLLCDFCDKTFDSRYSNIIHNAHHIVIPLLKQELHQCKECLYYYQTVNELVKHLQEKHNQDIKLQTANKTISYVPSTSANVNKELEIINISDDEENIQCKDIVNSFKQLEENSVKKKIKKEDTSTVKSLKRQIDSSAYTNVKPEGSNTWNVAIDKRVTGYNLHDSIIDVKNEEYILPDVYYDVKISPNTDIKNTNQVVTNTRSISGNNCEKLSKHVLNEDSKGSIHYKELTQLCNYKCKFCRNVNTFPNRYTLTLHQLSHLEISNIQPSLCPICDKYFTAENLKKHMKEHRNIIPIRKFNVCTLCHFKYHSYKKHLYNYHHSLFSWESCPQTKPLSLRITNKFHYGNIVFKVVYHVSGSDSDIVELCAKCFIEMNNSNVKCIAVGTCKMTGCLLKCSKCRDEFLEIKFVEKWNPVFVSRFKFEEDVKKRKKKTNEDRLRNIQMRLKMINKLSRFYMWFYLLTNQCIVLTNKI